MSFVNIRMSSSVSDFSLFPTGIIFTDKYENYYFLILLEFLVLDATDVIIILL